MSLLREVFKPLVENNVAPPARIEFATILADQPPQFGVPVIPRQAHRLGQAAVMVDGAKVTQADVAADNGVIHVIDTVIMPK